MRGRGVDHLGNHGPMGPVSAAVRRYRRWGADLPFGDPLPTHHAEMEGYFWRVTDVAGERVVVALCGVNQHPDGAWATVAIAVHPEGVVRSAVLDEAVAAEDRFHVRAGGGSTGSFEGDGGNLAVELEGASLELRTVETVGFPRRFLGGGGLASVVPGLNQYWHPFTLGGSAAGTLVLDGVRIAVQGELYREKNWGWGFPPYWWWGQAHGFAGGDVCVAFAGGHLAAGPRHVDVSGIVVRLGREVIRLAPPLALVRTEVGDAPAAAGLAGATAEEAPSASGAPPGSFRLLGRSPRTTVRIVGEWSAAAALDLPVPLPAERRQAFTDREDLAATMEVEVRRDGRLRYRGTSHLAALELGRRPTST